MLKLTCSVGLDACVQEQHTHLVSSSSSSLSWLFWKDCYLLSLAVTQIVTHITIISMLLHISLHGCFRLICSVFLDLLTQIEGSTFGGWLCDLMHISSYSHFLCVFVCVCACVISQGDSLVGLDHEQWVYRLEQPTRKLHSKSAFHQWLILKLPVCPTCVCVCLWDAQHQNHTFPPYSLLAGWPANGEHPDLDLK